MSIKDIQNQYTLAINKENARKVSIILIVAVISIGYVFFFNSTKIIGERFDFEIAEIGKTITLENNHTVKLIRADVDMNKNIVEFEFSFQNSNFDGYDDYVISVKSTSKKGHISILNPETVCSDSDIYVIRAKLPKSWYAVVADITVKNKEEKTLEAKFYETDETLYKTSIVSDTSREYFIKLDTIRNIETLQKNIYSLEESNKELQNKISIIEKSIVNLQERFNYMTAEEFDDAQSQINSMISEKNSALKEIDDNKKSIKEYQDNILNLQSTVNGG